MKRDISEVDGFQWSAWRDEDMIGVITPWSVSMYYNPDWIPREASLGLQVFDKTYDSIEQASVLLLTLFEKLSPAGTYIESIEVAQLRGEYDVSIRMFDSVYAFTAPGTFDETKLKDDMPVTVYRKY
jgi:hypothetical protein